MTEHNKGVAMMVAGFAIMLAVGVQLGASSCSGPQVAEHQAIARDAGSCIGQRAAGCLQVLLPGASVRDNGRAYGQCLAAAALPCAIQYGVDLVDLAGDGEAGCLQDLAARCWGSAEATGKPEYLSACVAAYAPTCMSMQDVQAVLL